MIISKDQLGVAITGHGFININRPILVNLSL